jgi:hypothetical protein
MATTQIDDDLVRLESDIRQLKIQYEQYFGGGKKRPPSDVEWRIDQLLKRYGDRGAEMNHGQRFRYGNLTQTYAKYREIFRKRLQRQEEGVVQRHFGAAARTIQAERKRAGKHPRPVIVTPSNASRERRQIDQLYNIFRQALEQSGEIAQPLSRDRFTRFVQQKAAELQESKGAGEIEFVVALESGKVRLKARVRN